MFKEFKKFIARGNGIDLAVGVVIGAAFSGIVKQLTDAVLMPLIGWLFGDIDFSNWFLLLGEVPEGYEGALDNYAELKEAGVAMIGYGALITAVIPVAGWAVAYALQTEKFYDILGGANFLALAAYSAVTADGWLADPRKVAATLIFVCSRSWLLLFLAWRAHERGGD